MVLRLDNKTISLVNYVLIKLRFCYYIYIKKIINLLQTTRSTLLFRFCSLLFGAKQQGLQCSNSHSQNSAFLRTPACGQDKNRIARILALRLIQLPFSIFPFPIVFGLFAERRAPSDQTDAPNPHFPPTVFACPIIFPVFALLCGAFLAAFLYFAWPCWS